MFLSRSSTARCRAWKHVSAQLAIAETKGLASLPATQTCRDISDAYKLLVEAGTLRADPQQQAVVQHLDRLLGQLSQYSTAIRRYREELHAFEVQRQARLEELVQQHLQKQHGEQKSTQPPPTNESSKSSIWSSWLKDKLQLQSGSGTPPKPATAAALTPEQKYKLAVARCRPQVLRELGNGPKPPPAPLGVYIYGSVGSGKTMLMDLFHEAAQKQCGLDHSRRMHFNAAMLEMHSRLHLQDVRQQQQKQAAGEQLDAAAQQRLEQNPTATTSTSSSSSSASSRSGISASSEQSDWGSYPVTRAASGSDDDAGDERSASAAAEDAEAEGGRKSISKWFDSGVLRQKEAKAAVLAIRKHLRAARLGHIPSGKLAAANAFIMRAAARSFIRGTAADPSSGWGAAKGHVAALLCFDEVQVPDVFTAAALKALFESLAAEGCVVVVTSNRPPWDLPRHGLHEDMFQHFINQLVKSSQVLELAAGTDYRRVMAQDGKAQQLEIPFGSSDGTIMSSPSSSSTFDSSSGHHSSSSSSRSGSSKLHGGQQQQGVNVNCSAAFTEGRLYYWPLGSETDAALHHKWQEWVSLVNDSPRLAAGAGEVAKDTVTGAAAAGTGQRHPAVAAPGLESVLREEREELKEKLAVLFGRKLEVNRAAGGAAWFDFGQLCNQPLGAADYMAISHKYHTVFLSGIPAMSMNVRDQARRFITLVDELYNARCLLVCSAACPPDQLFAAADSNEEPIIDLEGLQFETAVEGSRLRRNLMVHGGVAPVAATADAAQAVAASLGGMEEQFAFARAVSRLYEMQTPLYRAARSRGS